jgi:hypothetical protein
MIEASLELARITSHDRFVMTTFVELSRGALRSEAMHEVWIFSKVRSGGILVVSSKI